MKGGKVMGADDFPIKVWRCHGDIAIAWLTIFFDRTRISTNQFRFMPERSTIEAIFLIRQVMERLREQKDLHMIFIDLEKVYDKYQ